MYLRKLQISNLKGIESLNFNFKRPDGTYQGWTVLTGDNGSGKSSILKAICLTLISRDYRKNLQPSLKGWIRDGELESTIELDIIRGDGDEFIQKGKTTQSIGPKIKIVRNNGSEPILKEPENSTTVQRSLWADDSKGWFFCAYGPFRRVFGASADATREMVNKGTESVVTLFREDASLSEVNNWLVKEDHRRLEGIPEAQERLDLVIQLLNDGLLPNDFSVEKVNSSGLWIKDRKGNLLSWEEMSDGYRAALALMCDIFRHLIEKYGSKGILIPASDGGCYCPKPGVVLIDEIDAHLHPEWQREIGFWLKKRFPFIQFIVTTHSPLICQAADENGLFHLPEPGSGQHPFQIPKDEYFKIISSKSDTILLTSAFGLDSTYSPKANENRNRYAMLASKQRGGGELSGPEKDEMEYLRIFAEAR